MRRFENKVAFVTGTSGIGRASALRMVKEGAKAVAVGIDDKLNAEFEAIIKAENLPVTVIKADVSDELAVKNAIAETVALYGGLDVIVNAAAIHPFGTATETSFATFMKTMAVNVGSIHLTAQYGIPEMEKRGGGAIVSISSVQGFNCQQNVEAYVASKGAIHALTRALALDSADKKIRVNSVSPGSVRTPLLSLAAETYGGEGVSEEEAFARFGAAHALGRIGEPEEVAGVVAFLASDDGAFVTGSDYRIDGGLSAAIGVK